VLCVKFCFKEVKTAAENHNMLHEASGDDALSQTMAYEQFKHSKNGKTSTDDNKQSG
jgi:hypothetical protein